MKKAKNKIMKAVVTAVCIMVGVCLTEASTSAGMTARQLQRKFPNGAFWNHVVGADHSMNVLPGNKVNDSGSCNNPDGYTWYPCTNHWWGGFHPQQIGNYDCNSFGGSIECRGFSNKLAFDAYGSSFYTWEWEYMKTTNIKPGDVIWYYTSAESTVGHQAMIIDVDGTRLCLGECNWFNACNISWGRWFNLNTVNRWTIYSAPNELLEAGEENIITERKGDIDNNKDRNLDDANQILKEALGIIEMDETSRWAADLDGDGQVGLNDAHFSLKLALGIDSIYDDFVYYSNLYEEEMGV